MVRDCANVLLLAKISFLLSSQNGSTTYQLEPLFLKQLQLELEATIFGKAIMELMFIMQ
jgi:hypothetical protein